MRTLINLTMLAGLKRSTCQLDHALFQKPFGKHSYAETATHAYDVPVALTSSQKNGKGVISAINAASPPLTFLAIYRYTDLQNCCPESGCWWWWSKQFSSIRFYALW